MKEYVDDKRNQHFAEPLKLTDIKWRCKLIFSPKQREDKPPFQ